MTPDDLRAARKRLGMTQAQLAAALLLPSGEKTMDDNRLMWPARVLISAWVVRSHNRAVSSLPAEPSVRPSGEIAIASTARSCPVSLPFLWPVSGSHQQIVVSSPQLTSNRPSGAKAT